MLALTMCEYLLTWNVLDQRNDAEEQKQFNKLIIKFSEEYLKY